MQSTRRAILEYLRDHGSGTVDGLAKSVGLAPVTVRHHLSVLRSRGFVEAKSEPMGRGRPRHMFSLCPQGAELFIKDGYENLACRLLDFMREDDRGSVRRFFREMADELAAEHSTQLDGSSMGERLDLAASVLRELGYTSQWERNCEGYVLSLVGCPYHSLGRVHSEVCSMDLRLVALLTGADVKRESWRQSGDEICTIAFGLPDGDSD